MRMWPHFGVLVAAITVASTGSALATELQCQSLLPSPAVSHAKRSITPLDLLTIRDFGGVDSRGVESPFGMSPDGSSIALQLRRADPTSNSYCLGVLVIDRAGRAPPRLVDTGGELISLRTNSAGFGNFDTGMPKVIAPRWSPDGRWIAFLKRQGSSTQIWRVPAEGGASAAVTQSPTDIDDFAWLPGGRTIVYATKSGTPAAEAAIDREGLSGWRYGDRFYPVRTSRPYPQVIAEDFYAADLITGMIRPATDGEKLLLTPATSVDPVLNLNGKPVAWKGGLAWIGPRDPKQVHSPSTLHIRRQSGADQVCGHSTCADGVIGLWSAASMDELYYIRREDPAQSRLALYRWSGTRAAPHRILETDDSLIGCQLAQRDFVCAFESSTSPRRLVEIDLRTARTTTIFDPNPEFGDFQLGSVTRLHWRTDSGVETFGDLVLPPNHRSGERHPLVVVGYISRGFLRGGTGDEYPIQAFAARGFAVLSYQRPTVVAAPGAQTAADNYRTMIQSWSDRRAVNSAIMAGIDRAIATGTVDSHHIGLTGFSDGVSSAQFALLNSDRFAAVALSGCCDDLTNVTLAGPRFANGMILHAGFPPITRPDAEFWRPMSLSRNAARISAPILVHSADQEYLLGLETYQALDELHRPFELFVFPNEHHVKQQPAHRLAIYRRNLDWFDFWLRGVSSEDPDRAEDLKRWDKMRNSDPARL